MYATPEATITVEKAGKYQFMATLSDNTHCEYGVSTSVTVHVDEGGHGEGKAHHKDAGAGGHGEEKAHHKDAGAEIELGRLDVLP